MSDKQTYYNMVAQSAKSTVVAQYIPDVSMVRDAGYQSEAELERSFIKQLESQAYEYVILEQSLN